MLSGCSGGENDALDFTATFKRKEVMSRATGPIKAKTSDLESSLKHNYYQNKFVNKSRQFTNHLRN